MKMHKGNEERGRERKKEERRNNVGSLIKLFCQTILTEASASFIPIDWANLWGDLPSNKYAATSLFTLHIYIVYSAFL